MAYNKETDLYEGYIYLITNKKNGKYYIGQTSVSIEKRWKQHCYDAKNKKHNMPLHKAILKYGEDSFLIDQLECVMFKDKDELKNELNVLEMFYIKEYNTYNSDGYNATLGGDSTGLLLNKPVVVYLIDGTFVESLDSRTEAAQKYNTTVDTISAICNGKKKNFQCRYVFRNIEDLFDIYNIESSYYKKIYRFTLDGKNMEIFYDMNSAKKSIGLNSVSAINVSIDNPYLQIKGYWWSSKPIFNYLGRSNSKKVDLYDNNLNFIKTFDTVSSCARYLGVHTSVISSMCMGNIGICKGYIVRYHGEDVLKYKVNLDGDFAIKGVDEYSFEGKMLNTYTTATEAAISCNGETSAICACCKGKQQTAYNRIWRYHGEPFDKFSVDFIHFGSEKQVDQYTLDGVFISTWNSATIAANSLGHKYGTFILNVAKGLKIQAYGYVWRYKDESFDKFPVKQKKLKPINEYNENLIFIKTWDSASQIKKYYNYSSDSKIYRVLRKEKDSCDGKIFYYAYDPDQPDKSKIIKTN